jgi:hypothetical protein
MLCRVHVVLNVDKSCHLYCKTFRPFSQHINALSFTLRSVLLCYNFRLCYLGIDTSVTHTPPLFDSPPHENTGLLVTRILALEKYSCTRFPNTRIFALGEILFYSLLVYFPFANALSLVTRIFPLAILVYSYTRSLVRSFARVLTYSHTPISPSKSNPFTRFPVECLSFTR